MRQPNYQTLPRYLSYSTFYDSVKNTQKLKHWKSYRSITVHIAKDELIFPQVGVKTNQCESRFQLVFDGTTGNEAQITPRCNATAKAAHSFLSVFEPNGLLIVVDMQVFPAPTLESPPEAQRPTKHFESVTGRPGVALPVAALPAAQMLLPLHCVVWRSTKRTGRRPRCPMQQRMHPPHHTAAACSCCGEFSESK